MSDQVASCPSYGATSYTGFLPRYKPSKLGQYNTAGKLVSLNWELQLQDNPKSCFSLARRLQLLPLLLTHSPRARWTESLPSEFSTKGIFPTQVLAKQEVWGGEMHFNSFIFFLNIIEPSRFFSRNRNIKKLYFITNGKLRVLKKSLLFTNNTGQCPNKQHKNNLQSHEVVYWH